MNAGVVPYTREHGVESKTDKHGDQNSGYDGDAKFVEELANDAFHESDGQKNGHDGQGCGQYGQANLFGSNQCSFVGLFAHLNVSHNVFTYHDGIVNEQANAQAQRHQGHHVDRKAKHAHEPKRANQRNGQGQACNDRRTP